jgi:hypothetical protein
MLTFHAIALRFLMLRANLSIHALDMGAKGLQLFFYPLVATINLLDIMNNTGPLGAQSS